MKIRLFQSAHGDCLLVESVDGARILVDGGIKGSFRRHVLTTLAGFGADTFIDLVYISHVDQDHIGGILAYLDNLVDWRVFRHRRSRGRTAQRPGERELPQIGEIWHNAFHDSITRNRGAIERFLGLSGEILSGHASSEHRALGRQYSDLAQSVGEGIEVSQRISDKQLNIPLNDLWDKHLITRGNTPEPIGLGSLDIEILGPTKKDIRELRKFWNDWLRNKKAQIKRLRRRMARDEEDLAEMGGSLLLAAAADHAEEFGLSDLGDRSKVTEPNLASIMLFVEDSDGTTCLLTGDGHMDDVEKGLEAKGLLQTGQGIHVNCLKIAHHGSEHNSDLPNYQRITADNYIFCGNGHSDNPDTRIVDAVIDSRIGPTNRRSQNQETPNRFKLWFNTNPDDDDNTHAEHMRTVRGNVRSRAASSNGQMRFSFQSGSVRTISF
jgi:hypothetical protein